MAKGRQVSNLEGDVAELFTRRGLAAALGVHMQTVTGWEQDGLPIAMRGSRGRPSMYRLKDCVEWRIAREVAARGGAEDDLSPQVEKALLDRKRREELDLKIQVRRGQLVEAAEAERDFEECAATLKARLRRIPDAMADRILKATAPHEARTMLLAEIDAALAELSTQPAPDSRDADDDKDAA